MTLSRRLFEYIGREAQLLSEKVTASFNMNVLKREAARVVGKPCLDVFIVEEGAGLAAQHYTIH